MSSQRSKQNRPCGCGEGNYSFIIAQKDPSTRINVCRKCSHKWLTFQKVEKIRKPYNPDEEDE